MKDPIIETFADYHAKTGDVVAAAILTLVDAVDRLNNPRSLAECIAHEIAMSQQPTNRTAESSE